MPQNNSELISFLSTYNKNNKIERKTVELLIEQHIEQGISNSNLKEALQFIHNNKINQENTEEIYRYVKNMKKDQNKEINKQNDEINNNLLKKSIFSKNKQIINNKHIKLTESIGIPGIDGNNDCNIEIVTKPPKKDYKEFYENLQEKKEKSAEININLYYRMVHESCNREIVRHKRVISNASPNFLFQPLQCKICGLRYEKTENLSLHLDDHRRKEGAKFLNLVLRRSFFTGCSETGSEGIILISSLLKGGKEEMRGNKEEYKLATNSNCCFICGKRIRKVFDDVSDRWMLEGGLRISERKSVHKNCVL
ncbi:hypothetical protein NUSPORA_02500 [Nucleospora cyclopteri]